jgi:hypothetical protein
MFKIPNEPIAERFVQASRDGLCGEKLISAVKAVYPRATEQDIKRAAFFAVTRPDIDEEVACSIYVAGASFRSPGRAFKCPKAECSRKRSPSASRVAPAASPIPLD